MHVPNLTNKFHNLQISYFPYFYWNKKATMSFIERGETIKEGDTAILFLSVNSHYPIEVKRFIKNRNGDFVENKFQTIYGHLDVMELVGKKYGSKVNLPRGWAYVLHPTCELWTKTLPHRTQIIYTPDISLIIFGLDLAPGSVVIEAGILLFCLYVARCYFSLDLIVIFWCATSIIFQKTRLDYKL